MSPGPRANDRPLYYTMKTPAPVSTASPQGLAHSRSNPQSYFSAKPGTSPLSSPRLPPGSAGQPHPAKLSPSATRGGIRDARPSSPNYFGLAVDPVADPRDSCMVPRENWSSPSSSVKSFAAAIPKQLPLDANPEFEAFRRQIDANRARATFNLSASHFNIPTGSPTTSAPSTLQRPRPPKWHTQGSDGSDFPLVRPPRPTTASFNLEDVPAGRHYRDAENVQEDSAYVSADSKRSSAVSLNPPLSLKLGRQETSPPKPHSPFPVHDWGSTSPAPARADGRQQPQPVANGKAGSLSTGPLGGVGSAVAPQSPGTDVPRMISAPELKDLLETDQGEHILLLDLRVSPQFAHSRVRGALNLCIPTTLLKRATFNLQKLQQTFQADQDERRFSNWRNASHLVVYDASSSDKRDAVSAMNMIKKFTSEGYSGAACILRGGFNTFAATYPDLIDRSTGGPSPGLSLGSHSVPGGLRANLPPVIGGVMLPNADANPSPFFSNIRQNQDLVDGVGQMDVGVPAGLSLNNLPRWLQEAADAGDHGKRVSDRFLRIERAEQSRMREAYSIVMPTDAQKAADEEAPKVQLSGIEKGGKNRYKDILPFEHARVRLLGRPEGVCDYVNASYLQTRRSHKRYIASQGPLPATFEDFWSVVWDNDVRVIVMLTAESEGGQMKCHAYWKGNDFGPIRLRVLSEKKVSLDIDKRRSPNTASTAALESSTDSGQSSSHDAVPSEGARRRANTTAVLESGGQANPFQFNMQTTSAASETPFVIIRKFALSHAAYPFMPIREITQLHYPSWPDFGAPAQPSHLLALVELANVMQRSALPVDVPGTLSSSTSSSRHNSDVAPDEAGNPFFSQATTSRGSATSVRKADNHGLPLSWQEGPVAHEHARPMLVHCSAGCGRTGAFCTVDTVIDMLKRQRRHMLSHSSKESGSQGQTSAPQRDLDGDICMGESIRKPSERATDQRQDPADGPDIDTSWLDDDTMDLIAQTVEDFRGQRLSMVQSLRQFVLCYETILEWIRRLQESSNGGLDGKGRGRSGSLAF